MSAFVGYGVTNSRLCQGCRQSFPIGPRERNPQLWCSRACRNWTIRHPGQQRPVERVCAGCGVDISSRPAQAKWCAKECRETVHGTRRSTPLPASTCALPECGAAFQPFKEGQRCCSEKHGKLLYNRESRADGRQKSSVWNDKRRDNYHRRRALKKATSTGGPVLFAEIAKRDGWRCSICEKAVDPLVKWPDSKSPSLDHVVPLSKGGAHDPSNVALAHLGCNTAKNNRVDGEQPLPID